MRESLPCRAFPAIVMALGIIVLTPTPLLADAWEPFVFATVPLMVMGLIPIILIEGFVLRRRLRLRWSRSLGVAAVANLVSTLAGLACGAGLSYMDYLTREHLFSYGRHSVANFASPFILLVPLFYVSWRVEYLVARFMLRPGWGSAAPSSRPAPVSSEPPTPSAALRPPVRLIRGIFDANLASYAFLAMMLVALEVWPSPKEAFMKQMANQASAVGALRTINTSEVTYSSTYTTGFSPSLAALDGTGSPSTAHAAGLIDSQLASGEKKGYRFVYSPGPPNEKGEITFYTVTASPIGGVWHGNFYYTDQTGVIRMNNSAPATATDDPLAG